MREPVKSRLLQLDWKIGLILFLALVAIAELVLLIALWNSTVSEKPVNLLVIGSPSQTMVNLIYAEDYKIVLGGEVKIVSDAQVTQDDFKKAIVVIMQGEEYCDNALNQYVASLDAKKSGLKKFIAIGNACSLSNRFSYIGWDLLVEALHKQETGKYLLADITNRGSFRIFQISDKRITTTLVDGKFVIEDEDNPMFNSIINFGFNGEAFVFNKAPKHSVLATLASGQISFEQVLDGDYEGIPAIIKPHNTIYFAFDPSTTSRNMFLNTILYTAGRK